MKHNFSYYFFSIIILLSSCAKVEVNTSNEKKTYKFNEGLEYINLPLNRFFIYKDSATGITSNVKVTESKVETQYMSPVYFWEDGYNYETYRLLLSKITGNTIENWFSGNAISYNTIGLIGLIVDNSRFSFYEGPAVTNCFFYPFASDTSGIYGFIPVMNFEGKTYRNIHRFTSTKGLNPTDANYKKISYFWVKGIGIIKKETITNNTTETLLLIQYG